MFVLAIKSEDDNLKFELPVNVVDRVMESIANVPSSFYLKSLVCGWDVQGRQYIICSSFLHSCLCEEGYLSEASPTLLEDLSIFKRHGF